MAERLAPTLGIQGTASGVGKSLGTAALCRIYARRGVRVLPVKAQNMSNNASVTRDGREMAGVDRELDPAADIVEASLDMDKLDALTVGRR